MVLFSFYGKNKNTIFCSDLNFLVKILLEFSLFRVRVILKRNIRI